MSATGCTFVEACQKLFEEVGMNYDFGEKGIHRSMSYKYPKPQYAENKDAVYSYWKLRGISKETIDYLGINQDKAGNTLFQYYNTDDVMVMVKVRKSGKIDKRSGEKKCWHLPGADTTHILYNMNKINPAQPLIITCGEGDCATAIEVGFTNTVSIPMGDGNTQWISECWEWLKQFNTILLVNDHDDAGYKFMKEVTRRLGEPRVKNVSWDMYTKPDGTKYSIKDLNELLHYCGAEAVREAINNAKDAKIESIVDMTEVDDEDMSDVDGFTTGITEIDRALTRFYDGDLTIITGSAASGKSSFLSTLICRSADQDRPVWVYSGELSNKKLKNWVETVEAGQRGLIEYNNGLKPYYKLSYDCISRIKSRMANTVYFYKDSCGHNYNLLLESAEAAVRKFGVKTLIFDNFTSISTGARGDEKWDAQEDLINKLLDFAKQWNTSVFLVIHPKKLDTVRRMTIFDIQGLSASFNLAHRVISLYRVQPKDREGVQNKRTGGWYKEPIVCSVIMDILKDRHDDANDVSIPLWYDRPSRRFYDTYENLDYRYAWNRDIDYQDAPLPFGCEKDAIEAGLYGKVGAVS